LDFLFIERDLRTLEEPWAEQDENKRISCRVKAMYLYSVRFDFQFTPSKAGYMT